jgi:hypothetical protein
VIELADGVFAGDGNRDLDFNGKGVTLRSVGGDPSQCTIDAEGYESNERRCIDLRDGEPPETRIEGITLRGGYTHSMGLVDGAGIRCVSGSAAALVNCHFVDNTAATWGAGGAAYIDFDSSLQFSECLFQNNIGWSGGAVASRSTTGTVFTDCRFIENASNPGESGGAVTLGQSPAIFQGCEFTGNETLGAGGAVHLPACGTVSFLDCEFTGNSGLSGGGAINSYGTELVVKSCLFDGNGAGWSYAIVDLSGCDLTMTDCRFTQSEPGETGSALDIYDTTGLITSCTFDHLSAVVNGALLMNLFHSTVTVSDCTFAHNEALEWYMSMVTTGMDSDVTISNCIFAFNSGAPLINCDYDPPTFLCTDIYGNEHGDWVDCIADQLDQNDNFRRDPLFCEVGTPDMPYYLMTDSPCAEAVNVNCGQVGAWGVGCAASGVGDEEIPEARLILDRANPNPFSPSTRIGYVVPSSLASEHVSLELFDAAGRLVRTLVDREQKAGRYTVVWDGKDRSGRPVAEGVYFYRLQCGAAQRTDRVIHID